MITRFREFYPNHIDVSRHWCPLSQRYAGVDALLGRLDNGWKIRGGIGLDEHWFGETRRTLVYHFVLTRQNHSVTMSVLHNPVLARLLTQHYEKSSSHVSVVDEPRTDAANYPREQAAASKTSAKGFSLLNVVG
jgi:hypothetical protein